MTSFSAPSLSRIVATLDGRHGNEGSMLNLVTNHILWNPKPRLEIIDGVAEFHYSGKDPISGVRADFWLETSRGFQDLGKPLHDQFRLRIVIPETASTQLVLNCKSDDNFGSMECYMHFQTLPKRRRGDVVSLPLLGFPHGLKIPGYAASLMGETGYPAFPSEDCLLGRTDLGGGIFFAACALMVGIQHNDGYRMDGVNGVESAIAALKIRYEA